MRVSAIMRKCCNKWGRGIVCAAAHGILSLFVVTLAAGVHANSSPVQEGADTPLPIFEFHSGFWVNLHHFLYEQARLTSGLAIVEREGAQSPRWNDAPAFLLDVPAAEIRAWQSAVKFYAKDLAQRDLLRNGDMNLINNRLAELENCSDLSGATTPACNAGLDPELVKSLDEAAPVYRERWWPAQDRANRAWINAVAPLVRERGVDLSEQLALIYQKGWPAGRMRVDIVWYGGLNGAYTTLNPVHVTVSSHDPRNQGIYAYEVLFHESSHTLAGGLMEAIARECRERDKPIPRDLWHAVLFYTTGELVQREMAASNAPDSGSRGGGNAGYVPYAQHYGLYSGGWNRFRGLLDLYWQPYLDGKVDFDTAVARMANAL